MLRVAVAGCNSIINTGDEAELAAVVAALWALCPSTEIAVFTQNPRQMCRIPGIHAVNRWNPFSNFMTLLQSDMLLCCGNHISDEHGVGMLISLLGATNWARFLGKPVVSYALGVGPLKTRTGRRLMRAISNQIDLITVRNQASKDELIKIGVTKPPIVVTADPVFAVTPAQFDKELGQSLIATLRAGKNDHQTAPETAEGNETPDAIDRAAAPASGSSPAEATPDSTNLETGAPDQASDPATDPGTPPAMHPDNKNASDAPPPLLLGLVIQELEDNEQYKQVIAAVADRLVQEGWEVILIPFNFYADLQVSREVSWIMQEKCILIEEKLSLEEIFSLLGQLDLLLGMRLPALAMASVMRTPSVGVSLDHRIAKFLEMTEQPSAGVPENLDEEYLHHVITSAYEGRKEITSHLDQVLVQLRQQAWESAGLSLSYFYSCCPHKRYDTPRTAGRSQGKSGRIAHRKST